ncbi:hypothetical protein CEP52_017677 [Fusarium oligoseptatum]|nr:hypothetical protein CEP52_017677 [Fusarium oligoseptatum]
MPGGFGPGPGGFVPPPPPPMNMPHPPPPHGMGPPEMPGGAPFIDLTGQNHQGGYDAPESDGYYTSDDDE